MHRRIGHRRIGHRRIGLGLLLMCVLDRPALAWVSPVPDVVVYTDRSLGVAMQHVAARFEAQHGVRVKLFLNSSTGLVGLVRHGARADVAVSDPATIDALGGAVNAGTRRVIGSDPVVLVSRADGWVARGDAATLIAAHPVVVTDPTDAASFDGRAALRAVAPGAVPVGAATGPDVIYAVLHDPRSVGLVHGSAVLGRSDLAIVAVVGVPPQPIEAAVLSGGQSGQAAAFLAFVASAPMLDLMRRDGLGGAR